MGAIMSPRNGTPEPLKATACAEYWFRQRFHVPAAWAFRWCIDFTPYDGSTSEDRGFRAVQWLSPRTVLLDDSFPVSGGGQARKVKLVQIYADQRRWVATHIDGPKRFSQFRYSISAVGPKASALLFEGRELSWDGRPLSAAANQRLGRRLRTEDAHEWRRLGAEMELDYAQR